MSNSVEKLGGGNEQITLWKADEHLKSMSAHAVKMSAGFLRSKPERLFPNLASYWNQFLQDFALSLRVKVIRPSLELPKEIKQCFYAKFNQEIVGLCLEEQAWQLVHSAILPQSNTAGQQVLFEYLARRIMSNLHQAWTGPELYRLSFEEGLNETAFATSVEIEFELNGGSGRMWFLLPNLLSEQLDNLWRGELRSAAKTTQPDLELHLELAALDIEEQSIADYTSPGALIDLECEVSDRINLRIGSRYWLPARLFMVDAALGFEILPGIVTANKVSNQDRLSVEFGVEHLPGSMLAELGQVGACHKTSININQRVNILLGNEKVSEGTLGIYQGRFAACVV